MKACQPRGSGGMLLRKFLKIIPSEMESESDFSMTIYIRLLYECSRGECSIRVPGPYASVLMLYSQLLMGQDILLNYFI